MKRLQTSACVFLIISLSWMSFALAAGDEGRSVDRLKARNIISNVQLGVPSLANSELEIEALQPTNVPGLQLGRLNAKGIGKIQFLMVGDEQLYLLANEPIDLLSPEKLNEALAERQDLRKGVAARWTAKLAAVADKAPTRGRPEAPITILGFVDYECPFCAETNHDLKRLLAAYPDQVRYAVVDFPRDGAANWSRKASVSALCAAQQDLAAYWTLHDYFLKTQDSLTTDRVLKQSREQLSGTDIDLDRWEACATDQSSSAYAKVAKEINAAIILSVSLGVKGTPALYFNGDKFEGVPGLEQFENAIETIVERTPADYPELKAALQQRKASRARELEKHRATLQAAVAAAPNRGNPKAQLTIVEFSDFQCPYCADASEAMEQLLEKYGDKVRYTTLDFTLDAMHPWARKASIAAACAAAQSNAAYWTLHDFYFKNQGLLTVNNLLIESRQQLAAENIDLEDWTECAGEATSKSHLAAAAKVQMTTSLGKSLGVVGTPTFFINGKYLPGVPTAADIEAQFSDALGSGVGQGATP